MSITATTPSLTHPSYIESCYYAQNIPSLHLPKLYLPLSMADNHAISCLIGFMDDLWFHQIIISSDPPSTHNSLPSENLKPHSTADPQEILYSSINNSQTTLISEEDSSFTTNKDDELETDEKESTNCTTPRLNLSANKTRPHSSSPSNIKRSRNHRLIGAERRRLQKSKSLCELELEEVKGFMDLGFTFNKENMNKRMMSVIPGLQRLETFKTIEDTDIEKISSPDHEIARDDEKERNHDEEGWKKKDATVVRPYLSEAWLIKRTDSPLLNLRIPRVSTTEDMKKHLKYWAKTVALAIELES